MIFYVAIYVCLRIKIESSQHFKKQHILASIFIRMPKIEFRLILNLTRLSFLPSAIIIRCDDPMVEIVALD